ncbi:C-type lectin domain family 10 member A-like isoform 3-T3 [Glossophaga mutica]
MQSPLDSNVHFLSKVYDTGNPRLQTPEISDSGTSGTPGTYVTPPSVSSTPLSRVSFFPALVIAAQQNQASQPPDFARAACAPGLLTASLFWTPPPPALPGPQPPPAGSKIQRDLETLRATYSNFTSYTEAEVQALHAQGGRLQETITSLKAEVENHRQQLQAARSLNDKVFSLESKLEKEQQELKAGYSDMVVRVQELAKRLNSLNIQMAVLKSNGSQKTCCPINWLEHECNCYWFSSTEKPWPEAEEYCQLEKSHLVVVSSLEEQKFIEQHTSSVNTWMGLSDLHLLWFWVDWTDIETGFQYWRTELQDYWYRDLPMGSGNCVYFSNNGRWFYDICQRPYRWVCEKELNKVG